MSFFAVIGEYGPTRDAMRGLREQDLWPEHATFMNGLNDEGLILLGGPLGGGSRVLLVANASSQDELARRLAEDPWRHNGMLLPPVIQPWQLLLGELMTEAPQELAARA